MWWLGSGGLGGLLGWKRVSFDTDFDEVRWPCT